MSLRFENHGKLVQMLCWLIPMLVLCVGLALNFHGINWARFHSDERAIATWLVETERQPFITERAYPGGFFELYRPIRAVKSFYARLAMSVQQWKQQGGGSEVLIAKRQDILLSVRQTNATFIALSSIFVYWAARRIFLTVTKRASTVQSMLLAGLTAFIYVTHPFLVEHAHYGETDGTMVLTGAIVLALLTDALAFKKLGVFVLASLLMGFAIGCKYTLVPLLIVLPVSAVVLGRLRGWGVGRMAGLIVGSVFLVFIGFCIATPSIYHDFAFFIRASRHTSVLAWGEMQGLLGRMHDTPGAASMFKWQGLKAAIVSIGLGRMAWLLIAFPFWFVRSLRRHLSVFPLFLLSFPFAIVFIFPWFRTQEILPMLPVFSLTAVLPVAVLGLSRNQSFWRNVAGTVALTVAVAIAAVNLMDGSKMASAFVGSESRVELGGWFNTCAPAGRRVGIELYADRPGGYRPVDDVPVGKVEIQPLDFFEKRNLDYIACSTSYHARGTVNPFTGVLYEDLTDIRNQFNDRSFLLKSWCLPEGRIRPRFSQIDVEMRYVNHSGQKEDVQSCLELCVDSPFFINRGTYAHVAGEDGYAVGPQTALHVAGRTSDIRFYGRHTEPWYGVAFVPQARADGEPGDAEVVWRSSGAEPRKARVPFKNSRLFTLTPSSAFSLFPKERVKFRGNESQALCLLALYADPVPAARLLRRTGNPGACLDLLLQTGSNPWKQSAEVEAFLACVELGRESDPLWRLAAEHAVEVETVTTVGGIPVAVHDDFSRLRVKNIQVGIHDVELAESGEWLFEADLPMLLTPGRYTVTFQLHMPVDDWRRVFGFQAQSIEFKILPFDTTMSSDSSVFSLVNGLSDNVEAVWTVLAPIVPRLKISVDAGQVLHRDGLPRLFVDQIEVVWDPVERAIAAQEEVRAALRR